jgi:hypothetical protein
MCNRGVVAAGGNNWAITGESPLALEPITRFLPTR